MPCMLMMDGDDTMRLEQTMSTLYLSPPSGYQWLIILLIVVFLFGAAKLPDLARGAGQALKIFRDETKGLNDDDTEESPSRDTSDKSDNA